jgi:hypothetical protein
VLGNDDQEATESRPEQVAHSEGLTRRSAVAALGLVPLGAALDWADAVDKFTRVSRPEHRAPNTEHRLQFFTSHEFSTVRLLADYLIPADDRSGSASDAKVPEWIDAFMADDSVTSPPRRLAIRGGLAWMDRECHARHGKTFVQCTDAERRALLDDIAWPARAKPELSPGAAFFSTLRDLVASGFWSSEMGVKDLQYIGNTLVREWTGCPPAALAKLGVRYGD